MSSAALIASATIVPSVRSRDGVSSRLCTACPAGRQNTMEDVMKFASLARVTALALILGSAGSALAQTGIPQAPIGHRQPNAGDVPSNDSVKGLDAGGAAGGADTFGPALKSLPKLDIKATCRRAQPLSEGQKSAFDSCINDETEAQKQLSRNWFSYKESSRRICTQETQIGGAPSFVELVTCLELDKQAREAERENRKQLNMPTAPSGSVPAAATPKQ